MENDWKIYDWASGERVTGGGKVKVWTINSQQEKHRHDFEHVSDDTWAYTGRTIVGETRTPNKQQSDVGVAITKLNEEASPKTILDEVDSELEIDCSGLDVETEYYRGNGYVWGEVPNGKKWHIGEFGSWNTICERVPKEHIEPSDEGPDPIGISTVCRDCIREYHKWRSEDRETEIPNIPRKGQLQNWN